ncbi:hypothetical protein GMW39_20725 [Pectobacterium parmentieri]|uniref:hypothetical protein n=1 Tax=Pectobacterium parmentieri TaxID=1905730 RepID=UPI00137392BB|nr:hypothetical protein [Pectobacterium parmentieri]QHQ17999.1 hypothetical protein GMW39_20695 [Pectobacterium parmentieri]QHQ18005.1 hypothetical protein GMW39_20725 [Pectobacterium parmentieri]
MSHGRVAGFFRIGVRLAAGVRLCGAVWRTGLRPLLSTPVFLPWLSRCGRPPWRRRLRRQPSANLNVNRTGVVGLMASAERRYLAPAPTPLHWLCPARTRQTLHRPTASCGTARAALKPGSATKRVMAAAAAAAMMWRRQTGTSQRGGSVSAGKSARRGVRVKTLLSWRKT